MLALEGIADVDAMTNAEIHRDTGQQFKTGQRARSLVLGYREQLQRCRGRFHADKRCFHSVRLRKQFQGRRGDDTERTLGADEEVAEIVTGVVFLELRERIQNAAVGEHHFQPKRHLARHPIGERGGAAGVGGEIAADGAASLRAER